MTRTKRKFNSLRRASIFVAAFAAFGQTVAQTPPPPPPPPPQTLPTSTSQCLNGGWQTFKVFKNQGDCVSFVATKGKNPPSK